MDDLTDRLRIWAFAIADGERIMRPVLPIDLRAAADEIDRLRAELEARSEVSADVNIDHGQQVNALKQIIARERATIAALLAVPDEMRATGLSHSVHLSLTRRMAAVVEGER
jgi:hypothetical protein